MDFWKFYEKNFIRERKLEISIYIYRGEIRKLSSYVTRFFSTKLIYVSYIYKSLSLAHFNNLSTQNDISDLIETL